MALAAICPHCQTMFRVASDQLKLRGGIVRCGACQEVFDGNAALVDLDAIPVQAPQGQIADAMPHDASGADDAEPLSDRAAEPANDEASFAQAHTDPDAAIGALPVLDNVMANPHEAGEAGEADGSNDAQAASDQPEDAVPAPPTPETLEPATLEPEAFESAQAETDAEPAALPVFETPGDAAEYPLDFDTTLPAVLDAPAPDDKLETGDAAVEEHLVALPPPTGSDDAVDPVADAAPAPPRPLSAGAVDSLAPLLMRASAAAEDRPGPPTVLPSAQPAQARARRARAAAERKQAPAAPAELAAAPPEPAPDDEPEFVRRGRQREASGERTRILFIGAIALLALALLVQGVWTFKNTLAARYPGARPVLGGLCAVMGCKVELPTQIDALSVETGELQTLDASTFSLATLLRNQGDLVQAWPHLELALTDANDKTLVKRVFAPVDYLPPGTMASRGFAARSEQAVKLTFQLDQIKASGYHLAIFYP